MNFINSPLGKVLTDFYEFEIPQTPKSKKESVNYDKVIGGDLQPEVRKMLQVASQQRITLIQGLSYAGVKPVPSNVIAAVDAYLPNVWRIQKSLEFSKDTKIHLSGPLEFEWTTVLSPQRNPKPFIQGVFIYEVSYVLCIKGLALYNQAKAIMSTLKPNSTQEEVQSKLKDAMKELRNGAGIFEFLTEKLLPNWRKPPVVPPAEVNKTVTKALMNYFLCMAQRLYIVAAIITNKFSIVPRLFGGLKERYETVQRVILSIEEYPQRIIPILYEEPETFSYLSSVLAMKYRGVALYIGVTSDEVAVDDMEETFGKAVSYMQIAESKSKLINLKPNEKKRVGGYVEEEIREIRKLRAQYDQENSSVYFGMVNTEEIEEIPRSQHVFNITPAAFQMPDVTPLSFEEIPKPAGWDEPVANFNLNKHPGEKITDDNVFIPPGVDAEVFKALPDEVRQELVEQYFAQQDALTKGGKGGKKKDGRKRK